MFVIFVITCQALQYCEAMTTYLSLLLVTKFAKNSPYPIYIYTQTYIYGYRLAIYVNYSTYGPAQKLERWILSTRFSSLTALWPYSAAMLTELGLSGFADRGLISVSLVLHLTRNHHFTGAAATRTHTGCKTI